MTTVSVSNPADAYKRYGPALLRKAERVLRNETDAMDIVQSLFVDLLSRPPKSLDLSYLYTAVTNRCLNQLRNQRNRSRLLEGTNEGLCAGVRTNLVDAYLSLDLLMQLVGSLDKKSSQILIYHFIDDLNQEEVAIQMHMSRRAVVKRIGKIRVLARSLSRAASEDGRNEQEATR